MAATYSASTRGDFGTMYAELGTFTCDGSYPANGYALPNTMGFQTILGILDAGGNTASQGYSMSYNTQTGKLQVFWNSSAATGATVTIAGSATAAALALSYYPTTGNAGVLSTTGAVANQVIPAATFGLTLPAAGKLSEVANLTSLTGVTFNILTFGY